MVGWHHRLNGHELEQAQEVGDGQGGLAGCSPWSHKDSDTTELLNNNSKVNSNSKTSEGTLNVKMLLKI